jgi:hypothetical protein
MRWKENLIKLYFYVCEDSGIQSYLGGLRMSNNQTLRFTDEEIMTIYLFGITQNQSKVKQIYKHVKAYLPGWFPLLPSYQAFNNRLNKLQGGFGLLIQSLGLQSLSELPTTDIKVIDSMPIMLTGKNRSSSARVAPMLCNKGYCASKQMYYYGLKLHVAGVLRCNTLPMPELSWITPAGESDLTAARPVFSQMSDCKIYGDKIYGDKTLNSSMQSDQNSIIITPVKKGLHQKIVNAADDTYSYLVSKVRQPIESFFNWLIEKTQIQFAQRVRSENGLMVHVWGKFAAALFLLSGVLTLD